MANQGTGVLETGTRLGKYEIVRVLGVGSMGAVYEGVRPGTRERVAIKVLSPELAAMPPARARFLREAKLTARVRHPNIVHVSDVGEDEGSSFFVMEVLEGEDLARRLQRTGPLSVEETADIMMPVCDAVAEAHRHGITHRDLKPSNIFLTIRDGKLHPVVVDFGIATDETASGADAAGPAPGRRTVFGTPYYLAPEQVANHKAAGPASDQYALGVILYECLTGEPPFTGASVGELFEAIAAGNPVPPSARRPGIPANVDALVLRALRLDPKARFPWVAALRRALQPFTSKPGTAPVPVPVPEAAPVSRKTLFGTVAPAPVPDPEPAPRATLAPGTMRAPRRLTPAPSPAIEVEASTPSPFRRTLTPEVEALSGPWFAAGEVTEEIAGDATIPSPIAEDTAPSKKWVRPTREEPDEEGLDAGARGWRKLVFSRGAMVAAAGVAFASLVLAFIATRGGSSEAPRPMMIQANAEALVQTDPVAPKPSTHNVAVAPAAVEPAVKSVPPAAAPSEPPAAAPPVPAANEAPIVAAPAPAAPAPREPAAPAADEARPTAATPAARKAAGKPAGKPRTGGGAAAVRMHNGVPLLD